MNSAEKAWGHFKTITRHRNEVLKNCIRAGIPVQGFLHDLSKYTPVEFLAGCKYYQGNRSPNEAEREDKGYSAAWLHHKGVNRHHYEYWLDYNPKTRRIEGVEMPLNYVIEMFCDRVAASKIYMGEKYTDEAPLNYYNMGKNNRISQKTMHPKTMHQIEFLLTMLSVKGEEYTFAYVRHLLSICR